MDLAAVAATISALAACCAAGAALWGLRYAKGLVDSAIRDRQVDRVLAWHESFTTGEVGAARTRFSALMYRAGEAAFAPRTCWRPSWESLVPPDQGSDELAPRRFLGAYPSDMHHARGHRPIDDLRQILWCFERINEARVRESSLDDQLLVSLMGHAATWWSLLCGRLEARDGAHLYPLLQLAEWMQEKGWRNDHRNKYRSVPEHDFPGREDEVPAPLMAVTPATQKRRYLPEPRRPAVVPGSPRSDLSRPGRPRQVTTAIYRRRYDKQQPETRAESAIGPEHRRKRDDNP
jgi:hypothetical protein